jgi:hypothetical protein
VLEVVTVGERSLSLRDYTTPERYDRPYMFFLPQCAIVTFFFMLLLMCAALGLFSVSSTVVRRDTRDLARRQPVEGEPVDLGQTALTIYCSSSRSRLLCPHALLSLFYIQTCHTING